MSECNEWSDALAESKVEVIGGGTGSSCVDSGVDSLILKVASGAVVDSWRTIYSGDEHDRCDVVRMTSQARVDVKQELTVVAAAAV